MKKGQIMNKCSLTVLLALCSGIMFADTLSAKYSEAEARRQKAEQEEYRNTGGMLKRPGTQKGRIVFLDCQSGVEEAIITRSANNFEKELNYGIEVKKGSFDINAPKLIGEATLFIVNDAKLPKMLVAPEDKWAMVNVAHLSVADKKVYNSRVSKELSRGLALLAGGFLSQFQQTLTECVTTPEQLDKYLDWRLPFDTLQKMKSYLKGYGLSPFEPVTYRDACYEGWAPQPKDDIQESIMKEEIAFREKDKAKAAAKGKK